MYDQLLHSHRQLHRHGDPDTLLKLYLRHLHAGDCTKTCAILLYSPHSAAYSRHPSSPPLFPRPNPADGNRTRTSPALPQPDQKDGYACKQRASEGCECCNAPREAQGLRQPIGHTTTPSSGLLYAHSPTAVKTIINDGLAIFAVSMRDASFLRVSAPRSTRCSPPSLTSTSPYRPSRSDTTTSHSRPFERAKGCRVEQDAPVGYARTVFDYPQNGLRRFSAATPHRTVRAVFPHTALRVGLVSSVSLPFAPRLRFTLIPMDAPPYGRAVSDAPPHSGLSPIAVFRHYCSRHLICIVPFTRRGPSHPC